ncbi:MAG: hypothetical protein U5K30_02750 [Acidimicrobiales bacterium]|nr:hypothetical protein [Acidimicrobiales bacterium]
MSTSRRPISASRSRQRRDRVHVELPDESVEVELGGDGIHVERVDEILRVDAAHHGGHHPADDRLDETASTRIALIGQHLLHGSAM